MKIPSTLKTTIQQITLILCCVLLLGQSMASAAPMSEAELNTLLRDSTWYSPEAVEACGLAGQTVQLQGSENQEKAFNFMLSNGLSPMLAAAVLGNLIHESGVMPERIEGGKIELTKDPNIAGSRGWGIMQWTPATKIFGLMKQAGITTPVYELESQLKLEWWHMNNVAPTGFKNFITPFKQQTSIEDATKFYMDKMEAPNAKYAALGKRIAYAKAALEKYGNNAPGQPATTTASSGTCGVQNNGPVSTGPCTNKGDMNGNEAVLACARQFDPYGYLWGGGHEDPEKFMQRFNASGGFGQPFKQILDCSGLEMVSIWLTYGVKVTPYSTSSIDTVKEFRQIPVAEALPGDIMWRKGHTEFATAPGGTTTFGAHTAKTTPEKQIGDSKGGKWTKAYRYVGKGSNRQ